MALSETPVQEKGPNEGNRHERREKPPTKVIVRRLPPTMTSEEFLTQVAPIPDYDYLYSVKGDMSLGENAFSRVYINFCNTDDIFLFKEKFDNYVFVDGKGHEYAAVVEFASFQKIPKKRGKPRPNPKLGTIESDPTYIEFVESLKRTPNQEEKVEFSYQPSNENKNELSTPLLDYIKQRKIDRLKSREEKREERRRREIERKKLRDEEKRKRFDENSPTKPVTIKQSKTDLEKIPEEKKPKDEDKPEKYEKSPYKAKDFKAGVKPKPKYQKYEYEKRDYKPRSGYNRHYEDTRKKEDTKKSDDSKHPTSASNSTKKVKKYSERREERKLEVKKAEQKKDETEKETEVKVKEPQEDKQATLKEGEEMKMKEEKERKLSREDREDSKSDDQEKSRNKENDPRVQRRIRNKDRPTMQLYQPGMLSKRRQQEDDKDSKEQTKE